MWLNIFFTTVKVCALKRNNQLTFFIGSTTTSYDQFENELRCLIFPQARPLTILELKHVTIPELLLGPV